LVPQTNKASAKEKQVKQKKVITNIHLSQKTIKVRVDKMIKLKDLLREEDVVKNKKTGNVYVVQNMDPNKHDKPTPAEIEKTKAANGGQLPKSEPQPKQTPNNDPTDKPQKGQKLGSSDFKSSAEKEKPKRPGADDMKLKNLMPGIDTSKKTLDQATPIERQEVATKIDDLVAMTDKAKAAGEKPEFFNLCDVSIPGSNIYCEDNLGIDRNDMPQFKGDARPGSPADKLPRDPRNGEVDTEEFFKEMLNKEGIKVSEPQAVPPDRLKATQKNLVGDKVAGMYKGLEENPQNPDLTAPIYVSNDGYVLDGHHRWAAIVAYNAKNPDKPLAMNVRVIDKPIKPLVKISNDFADYIGIEKKAAKAGQGVPQQSPEKKKVEVASIKGKTSGKNIQTIDVGNGKVYGTIHRNTKMVDDIVDHIKSTIPKEKWKDVVFVGEGGATNKETGELEFHDEMDYAVPKFKEMGAGVDTFDGDELDVHKPESKLYKKQIEKTGLNQSQVNAGNWASMIGQGEGTDTMKPTTFLDDSGKQFLQTSAKEAGFPEIENFDNPTEQDKDTLYRLSFPLDNGDTETKVNDIQVAFNEIRDENIINKSNELEKQGKIPIVIAGEGHVELVKNAMTQKPKISEFSLRGILKSIK
jgi:hypothetical protein